MVGWPGGQGVPSLHRRAAKRRVQAREPRFHTPQAAPCSPFGSVHAFLYSSGKMKDLGVFYDSSVAEAINTFGVVVGESDNHAFIYTGGKLQDLNNLIPSGSGWLLTEATGINDTGQIVCNATNTTTGYTHAFLLNPI